MLSFSFLGNAHNRSNQSMPRPSPLHQEPKPIFQPTVTHRKVKGRQKHTYSDPEYLLLHHISRNIVSHLHLKTNVEAISMEIQLKILKFLLD